MHPNHYERLVSALAAASRVLEGNLGDFTPADIRLRCLVSIAIKEATRARAESRRALEAAQTAASTGHCSSPESEEARACPSSLVS